MVTGSILRCFLKVTFFKHKPSSGRKGLVMNHKTPISPLWLWSIFRNWGQETKYYDKRCSHSSYCSGNSNDLGAMSQELREKTKNSIWEIYFTNYSITVRKKILWINIYKGGEERRWRKSKTRRSPSFPQIQKKYIYTWNCSYRTPTERWQKTSDLQKEPCG